MLDKYAVEIRVLSKKNLDLSLADETVARIRKKLPDSLKKRHELLRVATLKLLASIKGRHYNTSFGLFRFVFFTGFDEPLAEARKQGVFRASKAKFNPKLIRELLRELYASGTLSDVEQKYIRSINGLLLIAADINDQRTKIVAAASSRRYFLKTVLSIAEAKYSDLLNYFDERPEKPHIDLLFHNNKESILTSASYLMQVYREAALSLRLEDSNSIDESTDHAFYLNLFEAAFAITNYLEAEIKVDFYDYDVGVDSACKKISVDNVEFEVAKSYGYMKTELRSLSQARMYDEFVKSKSYNELLEELWEKDIQKAESFIYAIRFKPAERIVLKTIMAEYGHEVNVFSHDYSFKEEQMQMLALIDENYSSDIFSVKIYKDFTCFDLFKLQRFFGFVAFIYKKVYEKLSSDGHPNADIIRKRSILPVFDKAELVRIFQNTTGKTYSDCEGLLDKFTNDEPVENEVIDLQYKPIVTIGERYLVMPSLFAYSSIWRSLAISEKVHFSVFGKHDYMVGSVSSSLVDQGFKVKSDFYFGEDELDVVAVYGENLFLFECKNPYHPVNDFELRNTYAHLVKGFSQLNKFKKRFQDSKVLKQFLKNIHVQSGSIKNIYYGVINANRALSGFSKDGVRVFHANELVNFVSSGKIISAGDEYSCWKADSFDISDFISYMDGEIILNDMLSSRLPMPFSIAFRNYTMVFRTFQYDLSEVGSVHKKKYRYIGSVYKKF
ncbi:hypothetical protein ACTACK_21820 [Pseudomonas syringae]|uniref:hypothetical protein n=1 Tax=Pseudomonas syringae TaxID=317 RepID=UPI003F7547A9